MKRLLVFSALSLLVSAALAQTFADTASSMFNDIRMATQKSKDLWNKDIYGPIMIINPFTRQAYTNQPDSFGFLKPDGKIFTAVLPSTVIVANASIKWNGVTWAMIMKLFIQPDPMDRNNLFCHELFHASQSSLGFKLMEANNNHLDTKDGRVYLRLELEALKKSLLAKDKKEKMEHFNAAITFRNFRRSLFPGSDSTENVLELNEGIAEYTGTYMSGRTNEEINQHLVRKIDDFLKGGTFIRTFAYRTLPVYGFALKDTKPYWNKEITMQTNLTEFFISHLKLKVPSDLAGETGKIKAKYGFEQIMNEENEREEKAKKIAAGYKSQFFDHPHLKIRFEKKKASFDARNLVTLEDKGIVYPTTTVTDNWGVITVNKVGALMSPDRNSLLVTAPIKTEGSIITGDGWVLKIAEGYEVKKQEETGNYLLKKKE